MKNMVMLDANAILRYILNDNEDMALEVAEVIRSEDIIVTIEVIAEVVYVLKRVYGVDKKAITESILDFISDVNVVGKDILVLGIETYADKNLDFIDCILYAYKCIRGYDVFTFDKKLKKLLS